MNKTKPRPPRSSASTATVELPNADPAHRVLRRFRLVFNAVKTHFQQVEKQAGIGGAQVWALSLVAAEPGLGVTALARAMDIHQATASNLVRALVAAGYLVSQRSDTDRRSSMLRLTPAGSRILKRAPGPFSGVLPDALAQLDTATLERLDVDLATLLTLLHPDRRADRIPLAEM